MLNCMSGYSGTMCQFINYYIIVIDNKELLNEVEHDIENYQGRGLRYPPKPKPKPKVDNTN